MRTIDGDALKIALDTFATFVGFGGVYDRGQVMECIDAAPTIGGWIKCTPDTMPETNDEVLTTYLYDDKPNKRYVESASYFDDGEGKGHWHSIWDEFSIGPVRKTIIAWMPMPKPYKPPKED